MLLNAPATSLGRFAFLAWSVVLAFVCIRGALQPHRHTVYPIFATAGGHWLAGKDLYFPDPSEPPLDPYRYSPLAAAILVPFHLLPGALGSILWRLLNAAVFLGAWDWWLRSAAPITLTARQRGWLFLLVLPLMLSSLNNGQANLLVIGFLLATVTAASDKRWWIAAFFLTVATALKIYPLAVGLLIAAVYPRRFLPRLLLALAIATWLPFALQRAPYVFEQYRHWFECLVRDDRKNWALNLAYRDLWLLFRLWHWPVTPGAYLGIQLSAAWVCAVLCVAARLGRWPRRQLLTTTLTLGTCWMTLCGPATESSSYAILAPALAWALVAGRQEGWPIPMRALAVGSFSLILLAQLAGLGPNAAHIHSWGLQPLGALFLFVGYLLVTARAVAGGRFYAASLTPEAQVP
jgi:hypothetical protein